ncbi:hypothetical protein EGR_04624 [Echinococcus granulosus]|uniref:Uncharacterized protein n=1 Tax=Echinococcus granulosus TaxID=6210 RepID=W6UG16_ECHGR|nr:hypothetical protein EGR_04624 [Echinococcus granulosus]EUB60430.1 hypothetical protein EGR_04624 [Echinococcus granulosus]
MCNHFRSDKICISTYSISTAIKEPTPATENEFISMLKKFNVFCPRGQGTCPILCISGVVTLTMNFLQTKYKMLITTKLNAGCPFCAKKFFSKDARILISIEIGNRQRLSDPISKCKTITGFRFYLSYINEFYLDSSDFQTRMIRRKKNSILASLPADELSRRVCKTMRKTNIIILSIKTNYKIGPIIVFFIWLSELETKALLNKCHLKAHHERRGNIWKSAYLGILY